MATEPPSPLRLEAPGAPDRRTPPASGADAEGTPKPAGGAPRFLNGCVPLSHQVAGHMYGKDKVGEWGRRGDSGGPGPGGGLLGGGQPGARGREGRPPSGPPRRPLPRASPEPCDPGPRGPEKWGDPRAWGAGGGGRGGERGVPTGLLPGEGGC